MKYFVKDTMPVYIAENRAQMGCLAGEDLATVLCAMLETKEELNVMFAAAPSQNDVLKYLVERGGIDWTRVNAFHMDEYIGLKADAPQGFGNYLREHVFNLLPFKQVYYINPEATDPQEEAARYEQVLLDHPMDVCILGVGENGHVAFNDPGEADFEDKHLVKPVHLDTRCRMQQVHDGCFATLDDVPKTALTVTIPGLLRAKTMFCVVPTENKAEAVERVINGPVTVDCPASVLRTKQGARFYCDPDAAKLLG